MNTDSKQFTDILNRMPKWHMLTPGVDVWRDGDEWFGDGGWKDFSEVDTKYFSYKFSIRRPIPESVRRNMAWWALYNKLATVAPDQHGYFYKISDDFGFHAIEIDTFDMQGLRKFSSEDRAIFNIEALGGEQTIITMLSEGPGAYERWVLEGI